jgi:hypothetical protein
MNKRFSEIKDLDPEEIKKTLRNSLKSEYSEKSINITTAKGIIKRIKSGDFPW